MRVGVERVVDGTTYRFEAAVEPGSPGGFMEPDDGAVVGEIQVFLTDTRIEWEWFKTIALGHMTEGEYDKLVDGIEQDMVDREADVYLDSCAEWAERSGDHE